MTIEPVSQVSVGRVHEITRLHNEITSHLKMTLDKAIRVGELLIEQKATMEHGQFTAWIENNLPFTDRTARNYMRLYREKDRLKTENVSDLAEGYKLLAEPDMMDFRKWCGQAFHYLELALENTRQGISEEAVFDQARYYSNLVVADIRKQLDAFEGLSPSLEAFRQVKELGDISSELREKWAEIHIRCERQLGGLLSWFEANYPKVYREMMQNSKRGLLNEYLEQALELSHQRIIELSTEAKSSY